MNKDVLARYIDLFGEATAADEMLSTAYHEAGHFVMAELLGGAAKSVSIRPDSSGVIGRSGGGFSYSTVRDVLMSLAGSIGHEIGLGFDDDEGATADHACVDAQLKQKYNDQADKYRSILDKLARDILETPQVASKLKEVALKLIESGELVGLELDTFSVSNLMSEIRPMLSKVDELIAEGPEDNPIVAAARAKARI